MDRKITRQDMTDAAGKSAIPITGAVGSPANPLAIK